MVPRFRWRGTETMSNIPSLLTIPAGPYFGFELDELIAELDQYKADRKALNTALQASSVDGHSFQFVEIQKQLAAMNQRQVDLQIALNYLDPGRFPFNPPSNIASAVIS